MENFFSQIISGTNKYIVFIIAGIMIAYIPFMIVFYRKRKNKMKQFLEQNPHAAKIFLPASGMTIISVNSQAPIFFHEGLKHGFLTIPGEIEIEVEYSWTKYGISKNTTTMTGISKQIVSAEHTKSYKLSYDTNENQYIFEEIS